MPPGNKSPSVTVVLGAQGTGDGVGVGVGIGVGVGVGVGAALSVIIMLSQLRRFVPPDTLRNSNRIGPALLTVKVAVVNVVELVVTVDPTFVHVEPLSVDCHNSHVLVPSEPYSACCTETVPALATLKFIRTIPIFRTRAEYEPVFLSLDVFPVKASSMYQLPVPSVTLAAA